jgi:hypothetical protein
VGAQQIGPDGKDHPGLTVLFEQRHQHGGRSVGVQLAFGRGPGLPG